MREFRIVDLATEQSLETTVLAENAELAGSKVLGMAMTRHPHRARPLRAKAYSNTAGGLTMVRLYESTPTPE